MIKIKEKIFSYVDRKNKWLGIIEYKWLFFISIYVLAIFKFLSLFKLSFKVQVYVSSIFLFPIPVFIALNYENNNIVEILLNIFTFSKNTGIYVKTIEYKNFKESIYKKIL